MEKVLERNGSAKDHGFAVGGKLTIADLKLFHVINHLKSGFLDHIPKTLVDPYHLLNANFVATDAKRVK